MEDSEVEEANHFNPPSNHPSQPLLPTWKFLRLLVKIPQKLRKKIIMAIIMAMIYFTIPGKKGKSYTQKKGEEGEVQNPTPSPQPRTRST